LWRIELAQPALSFLGLALLACGLAPSVARAQVSASLSVLSDYRIRGVSITGRRPALSLSVADDLANGVYFGGSVIGQEGPEHSPHRVGHMEYMGYAFRKDDLAWEVGADNQDISVYTQPTKLRLKYSEAYVGVSSEALNARVYYSPNYLRSGLNVAYAEVNGMVRPADAWKLTAHVGFFKPISGTEGTGVRRDRVDLRFDVVRRLGPAELTLGWATASPAPLPDPRRGGSGLIASATVFF
jgi:hypothetical protein